MASDINKEDNVEEFWSFINGDTAITNKESVLKNNYEEQFDRENIQSKSIKDGNDKHIDVEETKSETKSPDQKDNDPKETKTQEVDFNIPKLLKVFDDIEAFGSCDDSEPFEYNFSENEDDSSSDERKNEEIKVVEIDEKEEVAADSVDPPERRSRLPRVTLSHAAMVSGGLALAVVLAFRLLHLIVGTVREFAQCVA